MSPTSFRRARRLGARCLAPYLVLCSALAGAAAHAQCPTPAPAVLLERFIPADCEACWQQASAPPADAFVLDWIVPGARGDDAPLSAAALPAAAARAGALPPARTTERPHPLPRLPGLTLRVEDGPAWNGYIGLQLQAQLSGDALPAGASGYLALVDEVAAGAEGTPVARRLVRVLAGPLPLNDAGADHLLALRIPQGARVDRLSAVGWVEFESGRPVALAWASREWCAAPR